MTQPLHTPCQRCTMETRDGCHSWDHLTVGALIPLRIADAIDRAGWGPNGDDVPLWVVELIADECFADSPSFSRDLFIARCGYKRSRGST